MFRIAWKSNETGATGNGEYMFSKDEAEEFVAYLNNKHPEMTHWIESS